jgi:hypothetical protein
MSQRRKRVLIGRVADFVHAEIRKALGEDRPQRPDQQYVQLLC